MLRKTNYLSFGGEAPAHSSFQLLSTREDIDEQISKQIESRLIKKNRGIFQEKWKSCLQEFFLNKCLSEHQSKQEEMQIWKDLDQLQYIYRMVFRAQNQKRKQKRNNNFIKFIVKAFFKRIESQNSFTDSSFKENWLSFNLAIKEKKGVSNGLNKVARADLIQLFSEGQDLQSQYRKKNRELMAQMLRDQNFKKQYIYNNSYIRNRQNRKQYLLASKIYQLRCRSKTLVTRKQSR